MRRAVLALVLLGACSRGGEPVATLRFRAPIGATHDEIRETVDMMMRRLTPFDAGSGTSRIRGRDVTIGIERLAHGLTPDDVADAITARGEFAVREIRPGTDPLEFEDPMLTNRDVEASHVNDDRVIVFLTGPGATSFAGDTHRLAQAQSSPGVAVIVDGVIRARIAIVQEVTSGKLEIATASRRDAHLLAASIAAGPLPVVLGQRPQRSSSAPARFSDDARRMRLANA